MQIPSLLEKESMFQVDITVEMEPWTTSGSTF